MKTLVLILVGSIFLYSCAPSRPSYSEQLDTRPYPAGEHAVAEECSWIITEIYRMQAVKEDAATSRSARISRATASGNIAALENRAAAIGCNAASISTTSIEKNRSPQMKECMKACKEGAQRSAEECFDLCSH